MPHSTPVASNSWIWVGVSADMSLEDSVPVAKEKERREGVG
jgi:hypothetical protein